MSASHKGRTPSLDGCIRKLVRAEQHIEALKAHVSRDTPFVTLLQQREFDAANQTLRIIAKAVDIPELPSSWSLFIGDAVHNIRAALDYLVYELIALESGGTYWEHSQFPIALTPDGHTGWRDKDTIQRLGRHWAPIQRFQPYGGGETPGLFDMAFHFLSVFSNQDKHRLLVPVSASIELNMANDIFLPVSGLRRVGRGYFNAGVLEPGAVLAWEDFLVLSDDPQVYMNNNYSPLICFREAPTVGVDELLMMIHRKAVMLASAFYNSFPPLPTPLPP